MTNLKKEIIEGLMIVAFRDSVILKESRFTFSQSCDKIDSEKVDLVFGKEVMQLGKFDVLDQLVEEGNGYLLTAVVLDHGVSKKTLANYVKARGLERIAHGVYMAEDAWKDDYYLLSARNSKVVFSHESALYLNTLMDREPSVTTVTVPKNYNSTHIAKQGVRVIHTKPEWYDIGVIHVKTSFGNEVPVYDRERTMCDIIRAKKDVEIQIFQTAVREYMSSSGKNLGNLMRYAKALGVEDEIRTYTEVML